MENRGKKVAVIGAGISGLSVVKVCQDYGFEPTCFDLRSDIGGLWLEQHPFPEHVNVDGRVYQNLVQNTCRDLYGYADFPPSNENPVMQQTRHIWGYLKSYADNFGLHKHIRLNTRVTELRKADDYETTGNWSLKSENAKTAEKKTVETYNAVAVCTGPFGQARMPTLKGVEKFKGTVIHSSRYWNPEPYRNKKVLFIGASISAADISDFVCPVARKVYQLAPKGCWRLRNLMRDGRHFNEYWYSRKWAENDDPETLRNVLTKLAEASFNHDLLGMKPDHIPGFSPIGVSETTDSNVRTGRLEFIKAEVEEFTESGVKLTDGRHLEIDDVICCTGYKNDFEFMKERDLLCSDDDDNFMKNSYLYTYPINQNHPTLYTVILCYAFGAYGRTSELCARFMCEILSGSKELPSEDEMRKWNAEAVAAQKSFSGHFPGTLSLHAVDIPLSKFIGCYPDENEIRKRSPELADRMSERGSVIYPAYYRLLGPGADFDKAKAILDQIDHVDYETGP